MYKMAKQITASMLLFIVSDVLLRFIIFIFFSQLSYVWPSEWQCSFTHSDEERESFHIQSIINIYQFIIISLENAVSGASTETFSFNGNHT